MGIRIGTIFTGTVEQVGDQSIQTKFFMVGVPLIPMESYYVLRDRGNGVEGFPIGLHGKSVGLAYLRWGSFFAALFAGLFAFLDHEGPAAFALAGGLTALWVWSTFFTVSAGKDDSAKRKLLQQVTTVAAFPEMLPRHVAENILTSLAKEPRPEIAEWRFAHGLYEACVKGDERARAAASEAWQQLSAGATGLASSSSSSLLGQDADRAGR